MGVGANLARFKQIGVDFVLFEMSTTVLLPGHTRWIYHAFVGVLYKRWLTTL